MSESEQGIGRAVELIQESAQKAMSPKEFLISQDGRTHYVAFGGEIKEIKEPPELRKHTAVDLQTIIDCASAAAEDNEDPVVWFSPGKVCLLINDADRRDRVTLPLVRSPQYEQMAELDRKLTPFPQRDFIRLLRLCFGVDAAVIAKFRKLDWKDGRVTAGDVGHAKESLGQNISSAVSGLDELPEELAITLPLYEVFGLRLHTTIHCAVEIDTAQQMFHLKPKPGAVSQADEWGQNQIERQLTEALGDKVPVRHGIA